MPVMHKIMRVVGILLVAAAVLGAFPMLALLVTSDDEVSMRVFLSVIVAMLAVGTVLVMTSMIWPGRVHKKQYAPPKEDREQGPEEAAAQAAKQAAVEPAPASVATGLGTSDQPFGSYVRRSTHEREFVVKRDQISLAKCPELAFFDVPFDHKVAAAVALGLQRCGYEMTSLSIGGGSTEISHTGDVAYDGHYDSLKSFLETAPYNYLAAEEEAEREYGNWFTGLNWHFIVFRCEREGSLVKGDISSICKVTLTWDSESWGHFDDEVKAVRYYLCSGEE